MTSQNQTQTAPAQWGADFFGTINDLPPEPVGLVIQVLEAMGQEPTFQTARRELLRALDVPPTGRLLEAGCGTGAALADVLALCGRSVQVIGIDPTHAFLEEARRRARELGATTVAYRTGDIRSIPEADASVDAAFCDKVLLHVGPASAAVGELVRVTKPGGRVGALEWQPHFVLSSTRPDLEARLNGLFRQALYDYLAAPNLARYFTEAGLTEVRTRAYLAHGERLDEPPFWRRFLVDQLPLFVGAGLLGAAEAEALAADLQALDQRGLFRASFVIVTAVGRKPA
jgi:ubiquinone/menaquinone biosynthesis C-methylase UbiE